MPDEIEPALTPEEWRLVQLRIAGKMPGGYVRGWVVAGLPDEHHHAAMAVANAILPDGDPRKITHDDVLLLLGDLHGGFNADRPELWDAMKRLAMKLDALLPPDVTTYGLPPNT